jgi:primosomal replication protein N
VPANAVALTGVLSAIDPLRHTPAGIPLFGFRLAHTSQQIEAGQSRRVEFEVPCIALAETAMRLKGMQPGAHVRVTGFLNRRNRMSAQLMLHATQIELLKDTSYGDDEQGRPC